MADGNTRVKSSDVWNVKAAYEKETKGGKGGGEDKLAQAIAKADAQRPPKPAPLLPVELDLFTEPRPGGAVQGVICRATLKVPGEMNKTEAGYATLLELLKLDGAIKDYLYEEHRLKVGLGSWYTPDFFVTLPDGRAFLIEIKAFRYGDIIEPKEGEQREPEREVVMIANEDAVQKMRACALRHPFPILLVLGRQKSAKEGGGYEWKEEWITGEALL